MKKYVYIFVLCTLTICTLWGCKNDKDKEPEVVPETLVGNISAPTWTIPSDYDYTSSMTLTVKVDLTASYPNLAKDFVLTENDCLAAFSDSTCLGLAYPQNGLFFLYVAPPTSYAGGVKLCFYSGQYKNLFETKDALPFRSDANIGTVADPFKPALVVTQ